MVAKYLHSIGLTWDDVDTVAIPFPQMLPLLEAGSLDAASIVEPFITIADADNSDGITRLCNQYLTTTPKTLVATYVSSEKIQSTRAENLREFVAAMTAATEFIQRNEGVAREIIGRYTKIPEDLLSRIGLSEFQSRIDEQHLQQIVDDMQQFGYLDGLAVPRTSEMIFR